MNLDKSVTLTIDGKQYILKYNIRSLMTLENIISTRNILKMVNSYPFSHTDTVACLFIGLQENHPGITQKKAIRLFEKWLENNSVTELGNLIMVALAKAGAIGYTQKNNEDDAELKEEKEEKKSKASAK
nr:MAG TPA: tail assembly chaperone protein [Caudoviricetes sp.]